MEAGLGEAGSLQWQPMRIGVTFALLCACQGAPSSPAEWNVVYANDFRDVDDLAVFRFSDATAWRISRSESPALELFGESDYQPAVRSPLNIALIENLQVGDFDLQVDVLTTKQEYGHRDLVLFFGFSGPDRYFYVHIAQAADDHAHNIFAVDVAPRVKIASETTGGVQKSFAPNWTRSTCGSNESSSCSKAE